MYPGLFKRINVLQHDTAIFTALSTLFRTLYVQRYTDDLRLVQAARLLTALYGASSFLARADTNVFMSFIQPCACLAPVGP